MKHKYKLPNMVPSDDEYIYYSRLYALSHTLKDPHPKKSKIKFCKERSLFAYKAFGLVFSIFGGPSNIVYDLNV